MVCLSTRRCVAQLALLKLSLPDSRIRFERTVPPLQAHQELLWCNKYVLLRSLPQLSQGCRNLAEFMWELLVQVTTVLECDVTLSVLNWSLIALV